MNVTRTIPVLRIFDYEKAKEFYIDWLGFEIAWEHRFDENAPVYTEVSRDGITLHLSEHHGDATPGAKVFVWCTGLREYHKILNDKKYKYNRPGLKRSFYKSWCMDVTDPFANRISFNEKTEDGGEE
jgi:catechol 2,3-dioxygenase-like lactoylglutathione lyase family enzyme